MFQTSFANEAVVGNHARAQCCQMLPVRAPTYTQLMFALESMSTWVGSPAAFVAAVLMLQGRMRSPAC